MLVMGTRGPEIPITHRNAGHCGSHLKSQPLRWTCRQRIPGVCWPASLENQQISGSVSDTVSNIRERMMEEDTQRYLLSSAFTGMRVRAYAHTVKNKTC